MNGAPAPEDAAQLDLESYRTGLTQAARSAGQERARLADPDGQDEAIRIIEAFPPGSVISADDVRLEQRHGTPAVLGSAFRKAAAAGLLEPHGVTTGQAMSTHGRLVRQWRRTWT